MITRLVLPAIALGLLAATPAAAETLSASVAYGDLDLTKAEGRRVLDRRLARAVREVCGAVPMRNVSRLKAHRACRVEAQASYREQVAVALDNANARRVAVLADKIAVFASF